MLAKVVPLDGAWQRLQSSRAFKKAEEACGFAAVCVVGTYERQPRGFGDNQGIYPTRIVVTTGDPARASDSYNRGVPTAPGLYHTLTHVYVESRSHGERMKEWLEQQMSGEPLLNGWRDSEFWHVSLLFGAAAEALKFDVFDEEEKARRVWRKMNRQSR